MAQGFCRFPCLSAAEAERRQAALHESDSEVRLKMKV